MNPFRPDASGDNLREGVLQMAVKRFGRAFCALVFLCGLSYSQSTTGTLLGVVADPSDAAVPKAQVELRNTATGAMITYNHRIGRHLPLQ